MCSVFLCVVRCSFAGGGRCLVLSCVSVIRVLSLCVFFLIGYDTRLEVLYLIAPVLQLLSIVGITPPERVRRGHLAFLLVWSFWW